MSWDALKKSTEEQKAKVITPEDVFTPIKQTYGRKGLKIGVWGEYEAGKTYFALSAPPPVFVISTEQGVTQVAHHFPDKDIRIVETLSLVTDLEGRLVADPVQSLENVEAAVAACKDIDKGTIVIDTLSDVWDWVQAWMEMTAAPSEKRKEGGGVFQFAYARANERYKYLLLKIISRPTHFVGTARIRPVYIGAQDSGQKEARWQKDTPYLLDVIIKMAKIPQPTTVLYTSMIEKNRFFRMFNATKEDLTFDKLVEMLKGKLPAGILPV